jgi:hypothetical protein
VIRFLRFRTLRRWILRRLLLLPTVVVLHSRKHTLSVLKVSILEQYCSSANAEVAPSS